MHWPQHIHFNLDHVAQLQVWVWRIRRSSNFIGFGGRERFLREPV
jgi:hypothetical protein